MKRYIATPRSYDSRSARKAPSGESLIIRFLGSSFRKLLPAYTIRKSMVQDSSFRVPLDYYLGTIQVPGFEGQESGIKDRGSGMVSCMILL